MEADWDMTNAAMSQNRLAGDEFLAVRFYYHPKQNAEKTLEAGRPIVEDVEYIEILQPGNKDAIYRQPANALDKVRFAKHYQLWKARIEGQAEQMIGTPLSEWAGVTRGQVEELSFFNVRTVEQLANMADSNTGNMMGLIGLKQKAIKYLETAKDNAASAALDQAKQENAEMRAEMAQMKEAMAAFMMNQGKAAIPADVDPLDAVVPRGTYVAESPEIEGLEKAPRKRRSKAEMAANAAVNAE